MTIEKHKNLARNLKNLRVARDLSLSEFSAELDIPKTTLQSILEEGHTSLYTGIHISEKLSIPLDTLTNGVFTSGQIRQLDGFMSQLKWYDNLPKEKRKAAYQHIYALIQLMQEGHHE